MPALSRRQMRLRKNEIRILLAEGKTKQQICDTLSIHIRTLHRYMELIREDTIGAFDGKKIVDLFIAHRQRMEEIIQECKTKLLLGVESDVAPEKLYRTIQSASESITDYAIKVGLVPPVVQQLSVDITAKKEDDNLRELLLGHRANIENTTPTLPAPEANE